jgi:hypothetical protein
VVFWGRRSGVELEQAFPDGQNLIGLNRLGQIPTGTERNRWFRISRRGLGRDDANRQVREILLPANPENQSQAVHLGPVAVHEDQTEMVARDLAQSIPQPEERNQLRPHPQIPTGSGPPSRG